jgi:hypothetical protein
VVNVCNDSDVADIVGVGTHDGRRRLG